ncbi:MAG: DUF2953 domain-containing protein [Oscillospiraceae bacterium]|nr:DUF2953 domain-containing protein [Oscillospiraceae bacterium]
MITFAIIFAILILIALLRFGVSVEYSANGLTLTAIAGFLRMRILPRSEKPLSKRDKAKLEARKEKKDRKQAEKKAKKEAKKKSREAREGKKPGAVKTILGLLPAIKTTLVRLRRRLLIKKLVIYYSIASDDPYNTAVAFGAANAALETIVPFIEKYFRVKRRDIRAMANFLDTQQSIYINAAISLAIWEAVYIVSSILLAFIKVLVSSAKSSKEGKENLDESKQLK